MRARQLRIALATQVCAGAALPLLLLWPLDGPRALLVVLIGVATPLALTAGALMVEVATGAIVDRQQPPATLLTLLRVWAGETVVSLRAFAWRQPFAADFAEPVLRQDPEQVAMLLIHGYSCNRAVWKPLLDSGRLASMNVATLNLDPPFGSIDGYVAQVHDAIRALRAKTGAAKVVLVGHSMGGLVCRAYLRDHQLNEVAHVVTIATPHLGTIFGSLGIGINAKQMSHRSAYLQSLDASSTIEHRQAITAIMNRDDNLVVPRAAGHLTHARNIVLGGVGHLAMIEDVRVWDELAGTALRASRQRDQAA